MELCRRLQDESLALRDPRLPLPLLRHLLRPWLLAGWSAAGVAYALDHQPGGGPWTYAWRTAEQLRNPAGWLLHRMRHWLDPGGTPLPDPTASAPPPAPRPRTAAPVEPGAVEHQAQAQAARAERGAAAARAALRDAQRRRREEGPRGEDRGE